MSDTVVKYSPVPENEENDKNQITKQEVDALKKDIAENPAVPLSPEEVDTMRKVEAEVDKVMKESEPEPETETEKMQAFKLSEEERKQIDKLKQRYDAEKVKHTIDTAFKDAFKALRDQVKNVENLYSEKAELDKMRKTYTAEYLNKQFDSKKEPFLNRSKQLYDQFMQSMKDLKINLVSAAETMDLNDVALNNGLIIINTTGRTATYETMEQIAKNFKGNFAALNVLKNAALAQGCSSAAFDALLFNPTAEIGRLELNALSVFGNSVLQTPGIEAPSVLVDEGNAKAAAIRMGAQLRHIAGLCDVYLSPWESQVVKDEFDTLFTIGFDSKD